MKQVVTVASLVALIAVSYLTAASQTPMFAEQLSFFGSAVDSVKQIASVSRSEDSDKERAAATRAEQAAKEAADTAEPEKTAESIPDEVDLDFMRDCFFSDGTGVCAAADLNGDGVVNATDLGLFKAAQEDPGPDPDPTTESVDLKFSGDGDSITRNDSVTLSWRATNANTCTASEDWGGTRPLNGSETVSPTEDSSYTLTCSNEDDSETQSVSVTVNDVIPDPDQDPTFSTGATIQVNTGNGSLLNVRATPNGSQVGQQPDGAFGDVVAGPTVAATYTWYNVNFDTGVDGWVAEDFLVAGERPDVATTCTSFTYSDWGSCQFGDFQTRVVTSASPANCEGGSPVLTQSCTYVAPDDPQTTNLPDWVPPAGKVFYGTHTLDAIDPADDPTLNPCLTNTSASGCGGSTRPPWRGSINSLDQIAVVTGWTTAAASDESLYFAAQGGHGAYGGNEVYKLGPFNTDTAPSFSLIEPPSVNAPVNVEFYPDGKPTSRHGYNSSVYIPSLGGGVGNKVFQFGMAGAHGNGQHAGTKIASFDLGTNNYEPSNKYPSVPANISPGATMAEWDSEAEVAWVSAASSQGLFAFDPRGNNGNGSWSNRYDGFGSYVSEGSMEVDPERRILMYINWKNRFNFRVVDLESPASAYIEPSISAGGPSMTQSYGLEYDPVLERFVFWDGGLTLWSLEPPANYRNSDGTLNQNALYTWYRHDLTMENTSDPAPGRPANGIYGKFRYLDSINAYVAVESITKSYYVFKLDGSAGTTTIDPGDGDLDQTRFSIDDTVQVITGDGSLLNVRATPNGNQIGQQFDGAYGDIVLGPLSAASLVWYNVNFDTGVDGWVVENYLTNANRPVDDPVDSDPDPVATANFEERCADPDVILCQGFEEDIPVRGSFSYAFNGLTSGASTPELDTTMKASGNSSLKFTIPSESPANQGGSFWTQFSEDNLEQFGEGEEFWVQWRQRFDEYMITHDFDADGRGWKQLIVGEGTRPGEPASSCTQLEIVTADISQRHLPQMYHSCGGKDGRYEGLQTSIPAPNYFDLQPGSSCFYGDVVNQDVISPGCFQYVADEFITFMYRVKVGTWYKNDQNYCTSASRQADAAARGIDDACSTIELWAAREGEPLERIIYRPEYDLANTEGDEVKYGKVHMLTYQTLKNPEEVHEETYTWYDDLIVSRSRIADPE